MPKFTLIAEHNDDDGNVTSRVTHEFEEEFLNDVIMHLQEFLRGTGYYFQGDLGISEPVQYKSCDGPSSCAWNDQFVDPVEQHSDWYFDINRNR